MENLSTGKLILVTIGAISLFLITTVCLSKVGNFLYAEGVSLCEQKTKEFKVQK
jgi:hypothetical protein